MRFAARAMRIVAELFDQYADLLGLTRARLREALAIEQRSEQMPLRARTTAPPPEGLS